MTNNNIYETTANRLKKYNLFSEATINHVATFAQKQFEYKSYHDFFKEVGVGEVKLHKTAKNRGVPVIDAAARGKQKGVLVMHVPTGNSLDPNQLYQIATIAAVNPSYRVIAFGNPSGKPFDYPEQNLSFKDRFNIAFTQNLRPLVAAELDYLEQQGLSGAYHLGYSYGAHKALIASNYSASNTVKGLVLVDPVAHPRYPQQLLKDFTSSFKALGEYVDRTEIPSFLEARQDAARLVNYNKGLVRRVNVAIGFMLARIDFMKLLNKVLAGHPHISAMVAWGSKSELGNDAHMSVSLHNLKMANPKIYSMRLEGDKHAFANDIYLHVAIVHEALSKD